MNINNNEELLEEVNRILLENQVSNLETSLSSTIGFFQTALGIGALFFTILIVIISWWLKKQFDNKLKEAENFAKEAKVNYEKVSKLHTSITNKEQEINEINKLIKEQKIEVTSILTNHNYYETYIKYLEEKIKALEFENKFNRLILDVETKIKYVNDEMLMNYYTDKDEGTPHQQYFRMKRYYDESKQELLDLVKSKYEYHNYIEDIEHGQVNLRSDEIEMLYEDAKVFLEELNMILEKLPTKQMI